MPTITFNCSDEDLRVWQTMADLLVMPLEKFLTMAPDIAMDAACCGNDDGSINEWFLLAYDQGRRLRKTEDFGGKKPCAIERNCEVWEWKERMAEIESTVTVTP